MQIIIYSTTTCPYCKMLKDYLSEKGIAYSEKLIDQDEKSREEMGNTSGGFLGTPFIVITKNDGTKENIIGFDKGKLDQILQINQV